VSTGLGGREACADQGDGTPKCLLKETGDPTHPALPSSASLTQASSAAVPAVGSCGTVSSPWLQADEDIRAAVMS